MEVIRDKESMRSWSRRMRGEGKTIALVPTMGYLHSGHISLINHARSQSDLIVASIYLNPTQFSPSEDLSTYPSDLSSDIRSLSPLVHALFLPPDLYHPTTSTSLDKDDQHMASFSHETWVTVSRLERGLCGRTRPILFRGVATVVAKLFHIVEPDVAVFGKKDYQQWRIIQRMVRDLDFPIKVIGCNIVRDEDGLAMSSRNVHLSPEQRQKALSINTSLSTAKSSAENGLRSCSVLRDEVIRAISEAGGKIDYAEIIEQESLEAIKEIKSPAVICVAAWFGNVRLIDNMEIS